MTKDKIVSISYFFVHFLVEVVCFTIITKFFSFKEALLIALVFDFFAFVPQILFGIVNKKFTSFDMGTLGVVLMWIGLIIIDYENLPQILIGLSFIGLGNTILHECGAISTVVTGEGKLFPSALFVAGGSFGLIVGKTLGNILWNKWLLVFPILCIELLVVFTNKYWLGKNVKYPKYDLTKEEVTPNIIILIATFITFVRSFIGYAIPISWNKTLWQAFLLFGMMGVGKALGGFVSDRVGARATGIATTLLCIPFLIFGENQMIISIIGVFLFSMTMSITYGMLLSVIKNNPGVAFGFTTIALFLGLMPVFMFGSFSVFVNKILIVCLSIIASIGFYITLKNKENKNEKKS